MRGERGDKGRRKKGRRERERERERDKTRDKARAREGGGQCPGLAGALPRSSSSAAFSVKKTLKYKGNAVVFLRMDSVRAWPGRCPGVAPAQHVHSKKH